MIVFGLYILLYCSKQSLIYPSPTLIQVVIHSSNFSSLFLSRPWALATWSLELLCKCKLILAIIDISIPYTITCCYTELKLYPLSSSSPWALVTRSLELLCKCLPNIAFIDVSIPYTLTCCYTELKLTLCLHPVLGLWSLGH